MAPSLLYIVWHSEVLAADVYRSPSGILKMKKKPSPSAVLQDSAMVTEASNLRLHVQPRWLRCISIPASSLSALQNLVLPLPPSLPPRTGSRAFTEVNVLMSETDWYCSAVRRGVDAVFMCMNDCVCVHGWCSGLAELQQ